MARPKRISHFKLIEFTNTSGTRSWRVRGTMADGTRVRKNYSDKLEAIQAQADYEAEIQGAVDVPKALRTRLDPNQLADAEAAVASAGGREVARIVAHYLALEARASAKGLGLDLAMKFVESHHRAETREISVLNARQEFLNSRSGGSDKTRLHYETVLRKLLVPDPNRPIHRFTVSEIEELVGRYRNTNSKRTMRRVLSVFFSWCVRHHYCLEDPCKRLDRLPKDMTRIEVLSLDEVKRLLTAAVRHQDGAAAASIAIGLFGGLRPSELGDLKPEDITNGKIRVTGGKLRRSLKRVVPIPQVLAEWLKVHPFTGLPKGWQSKLKTLKKATNAAAWVQDIIRHTSITYQAERDRNEALTAFNNGTSKAMMDRHYRDLIGDDKLIAEFWDLTPAKLARCKAVVKLSTPKRGTWPDAKKLKALVWSKPLVHAAKDIGVSDVALRKRCVKLGIDLPPQGHWLKRG